MSTLSTNVNNSLKQYGYKVYTANQKLNLVSRKRNLQQINNQTEESILPLSWDICKLKSPALDIGTGAGFPGIPLNIVNPALNMTLLDSNRRKCAFLTGIVSNLQLSNVSVICSRAEEFSGATNNFKKYNTLVSRGVGKTNMMLNWAENLLNLQGELILWKDDSVKDELAEINQDIWETPQFLQCKSNLVLVRIVRK